MYQAVRGMRDFLPAEMRKRKYVFSVVEKVFKSYGFEPLETPALEGFELLSAKGGGGEEIRNEIYCFKDKGDREVGLRFDLTVPTARVVASDPSIPKPFKRYCIDKVWRYDRPQAGRYREFTQADIDVFGSSSVMADFEIVQCTVDVFKKLGFKEFKIKVNSKKVLEAMMLAAGIPEEKRLDAFRSIDKLDKLGWEGVAKELEAREVPNAGELIQLIQGNELREEFENFDAGKQGVLELKALLEMAQVAGIREYVEVDLSIVRGLEYYTGIVFEVKAGGNWSCGGGGRYDGMVGLYGGRPTPATGISYGIERVIQLMQEQGVMPEFGSTDVYVAAVNDSVRLKALEIAKALREAGKSVEADVMGRSLGKQMEYVNAKKIPVMVVVGPKDLENGEVTVKYMDTGKEARMKLGAIVI